MTLGIPHTRIRRIVGNMPARYTEDQIRADIRLRCDPAIWPADLIRRAEDYALKVHAKMIGVRH